MKMSAAGAPDRCRTAAGAGASAIYCGIALGSAIGGATLGHGVSLTLAVGLGLAVLTLSYALVTRRWG